MRLIPLTLATVFGLLISATAFAAPAVSVRAIAFVASNERGATDAQLAPYEGTLRANLRFESFHYVGENSASVAPGANTTLSVPGGGQLNLQADNAGNIQVRRGGTVVTVSRNHPAVFMGRPAGKNGVSGVIVLAL